MAQDSVGSDNKTQQGFTKTHAIALMASIMADPKRKYGVIIALSVIVIIASFFIYQSMQKGHVNTQTAASDLFEEFMEAREMGDAAQATAVVNKLKSDYPKTPYANAVELFAASDAVRAGKLDEASAALTWILTEGGSFGETIARIRLARIQLAEGNTEKALETINAIPEAERQPSFDEISGDIALAANQPGEAAVFYEKALQAYLQLGLDVTLIQMKLNQVSSVTQEGTQP